MKVTHLNSALSKCSKSGIKLTKPESNLGLIYALKSGLSFLPLNVFNS